MIFIVKNQEEIVALNATLTIILKLDNVPKLIRYAKHTTPIMAIVSPVSKDTTSGH